MRPEKQIDSGASENCPASINSLLEALVGESGRVPTQRCRQ